MLLSVIDVVLRGCAVGLAASITVGPVAVLCIQRTLSKTTRAGLFSGLGVACADTFMAIIAYFFYAMMQSYIEQYSTYLSLGGGIFVVVVGVMIFLKNPQTQIRRNRTGSTTFWKDFVSMFGFTIANFVVVIPYLLAFFAMFGVGTDSSHSSDSSWVSLLHSVLIIFGFFCGAVAWWSMLTGIISLFRRKFRPSHLVTINRVAGVIVGLLGICTLVQTFYTLIIQNGIAQ